MAASAGPQSILVIDDERGPRESLRILLKNDYQVFCADSVDWGLQMLAQNPPDAIIMDIRMPGVNGIEGLRRIRQIDPNVSVIMLTGFGTLETAQEAIRLGANDYIKKPFDATEMQDVIRRNVQRTRFERRRWRAEQKLKDLNTRLMDQLAEKEYMASLGQKSAELVHDLRNPLTAVLGYVDLLADELKRSKEKLGERWTDTADYIDMIEKSVNRCKDLAEMWLSLGKQDPQRMKTLELRELVRDVVKAIGPIAAQRGVRVVYQGDDTPCEIAADALQVTRAFQNVLSNAVEAVPEKVGSVRVACVSEGAEAVIRVEDNGCGLESEQLDRMFQPYVTTKVNGTGLGLFITKKVIEDHHGSIELQSKTGQGTTVTIRLPRLKRPEVAVA